MAQKTKITIASAAVIGILIVIVVLIAGGNSLTAKFYEASTGNSESDYPSCGDGADNDFDGLFDCNDPDCAGQICSYSPCPQGSEGAGIIGNCPQSIQGTGIQCGAAVTNCA